MRTSATSNVGKEADFIVLDPAATPHLARRIDRATTLDEKLFALMILGDDRAVHATHILGTARTFAPAPDASDGLGMERTLLARHADVLVTMDDTRREIADGAVFVRGNRIERVGTTAEMPPSADTVIELAGHVLLPGLVNTHHHMFQTLTRVVPAAQDSELFGWLQALIRCGRGSRPEAIRISALTAMAELCSPDARRRATTSTRSRMAAGSTTRSRPPGISVCASIPPAAR
jgi:cytosine/adenosine deaminase-related metal-dependent hydrolase